MENNLIINGIDFDKRLQSARRSLHLNIDWRAQLAGLGPFFKLEHIQPQEDEVLALFKHRIQEIREMPQRPLDFDDTPENRQKLIDVYVKQIEQYLAYKKPEVKFHLIRIREQ